MRTPRFETPPELKRDWQGDLLKRYVGKGYIMAAVVRVPPEQPMERRPEVGERYDYTSVLLPDETPEDAQLRAAYEAEMKGLALECGGRDNIRVAYPTEEMIEGQPLYGTHPYHILLVPAIPLES